MTILDWLQESMVRLRSAGVDSPRRDCLVLVEDFLEKDRAWVLAHAEHELKSTQLDTLEEQLKRRVAREPLAYIRGKAWFYGRFFKVDKKVMIPRPESEDFIEILKELKPKKLIDIGTGSGCLAITAKLELPKLEVLATDISSKALAIAKVNSRNHAAKINFVCGSLLEPLSNFDFADSAVVANLPYVPENLITSPEIEREPALALFSGEDGLDHYRKFWQQVGKLKTEPKYILTESLETQHKPLEELAQKAGYKLIKTSLLIQLYEKY